MRRDLIIAAYFWLAANGIAVMAAESFRASGITESFLDVTLSAPVSGIISRQRFQEGDKVKQGDVIIELDKRLEELEAARRKLVMINRQTDLEATQTLFKNSKSVSKQELDEREVEYRVASLEYEQAEEQVKRRQVLAPFSGIIADITLDVGEACQPYQALIRLVDTQRALFITNLEARNAPPLQLGQTVQLEIEMSGPPVKVQGQVIFLSPVVDPASGLFKVKVLFDNPNGQIRPGQAGQIILP